MKILRRFLVWFAIIFLSVFIILTLYIKFYGKSMILRVLESSLKTTVTIDDIYYHIPFGFSAYHIKVGDTFRSEAVSAQIEPQSFFERKLILSDVIFIKPSLVIKRQTKSVSPSPSENNQPDNAKEEGGPATGVQQNTDVATQAPPPVPLEEKGPGQDQKFSISINHLLIEGGQVQYDNDTDGGNFRFHLQDIQIKAQRIIYPFKPVQTQFRLVGRLAQDQNPLAGSTVEASGWLNVARKDMQAQLKVENPETKGGLMADIVSRDNHVTVSGDLKINNFLINSKDKKPSEVSSTEDIVFNTLSSMGVEIGAKFSFETKMDDFQISNIAFTGNVSAKSMSEMLPSVHEEK